MPKPIILCSIECSKTVAELTRAVGDTFLVRSCTLSQLAVNVKDPFAVAIVVANMKGERNQSLEATEMLESVRSARSAVRRIVVTDHDDLSSTLDAIHGSLVHGVLYRPLSIREIRNVLRPSNSTHGEMVAESTSVFA